MSALALPAPAAAPTRTATVDIVVPVYNEAADLAASVRRLEAYLATGFPFEYRIVVADNASTDGTWQTAQRLARHERVSAIHLDAKGRGRALRRVWLASDADVVAYMDVDLSTDLNALLPLVAPLVSGHSDMAIGTRLARGSRVVRGPKREFISRSYNLLLRTVLRAGFSDAQCGFKAVRRDVAQRLLPLVEDDNWFFDTELLVLAQREGLRIHEVPVDWTDDPGSTVDIVATAAEDLRGVWRLLHHRARPAQPLVDPQPGLHPQPLLSTQPPVEPQPLAATQPLVVTQPLVEPVETPHQLPGQLLRFAAIGVVSTMAYLGLYLLLRPLGAQAANLIALLVTAVANTAANRRLTFGISGREGALRHHLGGLAAFAAALGLASGSLWLLDTLRPGASRLVEVVVLVVANAAATLLRFVALRLLMHRR